jgi:tetratricopeptide (TPR) repeat protein
MSIRAFADRLRRWLKAWCHRKLGRFYFNRGDLSRARDHFLTSIKADESSCSAHLYLFEIYVFQKRFGKALEELSRAREIDPKECDSYHLRPDHLVSFAEYLKDAKQVRRLTSRRMSAGLISELGRGRHCLPFGDFLDRIEYERFQELPPIREQDISKIDWDHMTRYLLESQD